MTSDLLNSVLAIDRENKYYFLSAIIMIMISDALFSVSEMTWGNIIRSLNLGVYPNLYKTVEKTSRY